MRNPSSRPVTSSAVAHAERIRAGETERAQHQQAPTGTTAEHYAERALAGHRADEELRMRARMNELRARGVIGADEEPDDEEEYDDTEQVEEFEEEPEDDDENVSTAELYARRERARQRAEHKATVAAHRGSTWLITERATRPIF